ncbi:MAG: hypothetical protein ACC628_11160 [Pirellulaceae bacterium]
MALALQERGIGRRDWLEWITGVVAFREMPRDQVDRVVEWMLQQEILWDDQGILWLGQKGEETYGRRNFLELFSVFVSPPLFSVLHGRQGLGYVDELTFLGKQDGPRILLLGGRAWRVNHIDWQRKVAHVEATDAKGRSRWKGQGPGLTYRMSQAIKRVLATEDSRDLWSRRAKQQLDEIRIEFPWVETTNSQIAHSSDSELTWWTFAGNGANATIANELAHITRSRVDHDNFTLTFATHVDTADLERTVDELRTREVAELRPSIDDRAIDGLKFSACLSRDLGMHVLEQRLLDRPAVSDLLETPLRIVTTT